MDVCCTQNNKKCYYFITKTYPDKIEQGWFSYDGLVSEWFRKNWMNCPHSETEKWVKKACQEFIENKKETMAQGISRL